MNTQTFILGFSPAFSKAKNALGSNMLVILAFTLILINSRSYAQEIQWPSTDAKWYFAIHGDLGQITGFALAEQYGDTIVNGKNYHFLDGILASGLIRSEGEKVYFMPNDSLHEILIYDFGLKEGDTFYNSNWSVSPDQEDDYNEVVSVSSFMDNQGNLRRSYVLGYHAVAEWYEGFGSFWSVTKTPYIGSVSGGYNLVCFVENNEVVYGHVEWCTNELIVANNEEKRFKRISVFPNPTSNILNINFGKYFSKVDNIYLVDPNSTYHKLPIQNEINLFRFTPGLYTLIIWFEDGSRFSQRIVKL